MTSNHITNTNNILQLSNEFKRKELDQVYNDLMKDQSSTEVNENKDDNSTPNGPIRKVKTDLVPLKEFKFFQPNNIINSNQKNVHFEKTTTSIYNNGKVNNFNSTFTIQIKKSLLPSVEPSNYNQINKIITATSTKAILKSPTPKLNKNTNKNTQLVVKKFSNFEQRKRDAIEKKAKFDKDLLSIRKKVIVRKFAYIWLDRFFHPSRGKFTSTKYNLILPSQAE
jgi:hypothetical protein